MPQLYIDVDRIAAMTKQVYVGDLFDTMRVYLGSLYVNDINLFGRTWRVTVQAEPRYRDQIEDIARLKVRNAEGHMVPLGAIANVRMDNRPQVLTRYNMYPAAPINGASAPGTSSGEGIAIMQEVGDRELLRTMAYEWTELAYLELQAGSTAMDTQRAFAVVMVFLVLAAQYESWSLPLGDHPGRPDVPVLPRSSACLVREAWTSTFSHRSASSCLWGWRARTRS